MIYLIAYQLSDGKKALAVDQQNAFCGGEVLEETKKNLPNYNGYHAAGTTWSASATIYWMQYRPCVVGFNSMDEIKESLLDHKIIRAHSVAGSANYTLIKDDFNLNIVFDPKLIDENVDTAKPFYEK
jgi:hypothetical protein